MAAYSSLLLPFSCILVISLLFCTSVAATAAKATSTSATTPTPTSAKPQQQQSSGTHTDTGQQQRRRRRRHLEQVREGTVGVRTAGILGPGAGVGGQNNFQQLLGKEREDELHPQAQSQSQLTAAIPTTTAPASETATEGMGLVQLIAMSVCGTLLLVICGTIGAAIVVRVQKRHSRARVRLSELAFTKSMHDLFHRSTNLFSSSGSLVSSFSSFGGGNSFVSGGSGGYGNDDDEEGLDHSLKERPSRDHSSDDNNTAEDSNRTKTHQRRVSFDPALAKTKTKTYHDQKDDADPSTDLSNLL